MGHYNVPPNLFDDIRRINERISALVNSQAVAQYATAGRPDPAKVKGLIIFNTTTNKHEGSDGSSWNPLY